MSLELLMFTGRDRNFTPTSTFETDSARFGKVMVKAHFEYPEPENGFPGAWMLDAVWSVEENLVEFFEDGRRVDYADDVMGLLDWYEREEFALQAGEEFEGSGNRARLDLEERG